MGVERAPAPGKPCLGAMGGEVRLPPGEPCREGECLPRAGGPGIWVAMRSNGLSRVLAEAREGYTPTLDAFTVHACIQSLSQHPARQQLLIGAYNVPAAAGKPESVEQDLRGSHPRAEGRSL